MFHVNPNIFIHRNTTEIKTAMTKITSSINVNTPALIMPVAEFYTNGAFLSNICNCLYGNKTQQYFEAVQFMLDEYLNLIVEETSDKTETTSDNDVSDTFLSKT